MAAFFRNKQISNENKEDAVYINKDSGDGSAFDRIQEVGSFDRDPYDEDQAELLALHSKPTCFIMLGKPGAGKTTLARHLAREFECEMLNVTDIIAQAMETKSKQGIIAQEILLKGESISDELVFAILEEKINSPEVAHHGYILDGFPAICENFISIQDQLSLIKSWKLKPNFIINIKIPDPDLQLRRTGQRFDPITGDLYTKHIYDPQQTSHADNDGNEDDAEDEEDAGGIL